LPTRRSSDLPRQVAVGVVAEVGDRRPAGLQVGSHLAHIAGAHVEAGLAAAQLAAIAVHHDAVGAADDVGGLVLVVADQGANVVVRADVAGIHKLDHVAVGIVGVGFVGGLARAALPFVEPSLLADQPREDRGRGAGEVGQRLAGAHIDQLVVVQGLLIGLAGAILQPLGLQQALAVEAVGAVGLHRLAVQGVALGGIALFAAHLAVAVEIALVAVIARRV